MVNGGYVLLFVDAYRFFIYTHTNFLGCVLSCKIVRDCEKSILTDQNLIKLSEHVYYDKNAVSLIFRTFLLPPLPLYISLTFCFIYSL